MSEKSYSTSELMTWMPFFPFKYKAGSDNKPEIIGHFKIAEMLTF